MRRPSDELSSATRIASSPILLAPWTRAAVSAARFTAPGRALPTLFRTPMVAHALTSRVPAPRQLRALVSALHGRLSVVNPPRSIRLPAGLATAIRELVRTGFDANHIGKDRWGASYALHMVRALLSALPPPARDRLSLGVDWAALGLYESTAPRVRRLPSDEDRPTGDLANAVAEAEIVYRLGLMVGSGTAPDWRVIDSAVDAAQSFAWPVRKRARPLGDSETTIERQPPWFVGTLLVPDAWLAAHADPELLAYWARLTGRSGEPDRYWFPEAWDRFLEPGRRVGWLTANDVWRRRRGRLPTAASLDAEAAAGDEWTARRYVASPLTPDLERGVGVPPGYALVRCAGTLEVAFATTP